MTDLLVLVGDGESAVIVGPTDILGIAPNCFSLSSCMAALVTSGEAGLCKDDLFRLFSKSAAGSG